MKAKYRLFRRGKIFYAENATTGKQQSLHTSDTQEAKRLIAAKNEAVNNAQLTLAVGKAYLAVTDPEMLTRTWFEVIGFVERLSKGAGYLCDERGLHAGCGGVAEVFCHDAEQNALGDARPHSGGDHP
jgi:hypothetical protein